MDRPRRRTSLQDLLAAITAAAGMFGALTAVLRGTSADLRLVLAVPAALVASITCLLYGCRNGLMAGLVVWLALVCLTL